MTTFIQLYKQSQKASPREVFMQQLSRGTGYSIFTIEAWGNGKRRPSRKAAEKVSEFLRMSVEELFPDL